MTRHPHLEEAGFRRHLWAALAAGLLLRLALAWVPVDPMLNPDSRSFVELARSLVERGRLAYVDQGAPGLELLAFRSLLYPVFLAPFAGGGNSGVAMAALLCVQAILGLGTVALLAWLARAALGTAAGTVTAWCGALYGPAILSERQITSEALFTPLLALGAVLTVRARGPWGGIAAGACLGLAALTRPAGLVAAVAIAVVLLATRLAGPALRRGATAGTVALGLLLGTTIAVLPAIVRNQAVLGSPVLLTSGGMNFWIGNGRGSVGDAWQVMAREAPGRGELGMDRWFYADTFAHKDEIVRNLPQLLAEKTRTYFTPFARDAWDLPWRLLWPLAVVGVFVLRPRDGVALAVIGAILVSQTLLAYATVPWARYRLPMEPFLWPLAAASLVRLGGRPGPGRWAVAGVGAANLAWLALQLVGDATS